MIRDGLNTYPLVIHPKTKLKEEITYKEDFFDTVVGSYNAYQVDGSINYFQYLRDPYALLLLTDVFNFKLPDDWPEYMKEPQITCKEVVNALISEDKDQIFETLGRMTQPEQAFIFLLSTRDTALVPPLPFFQVIGKSLGLRGVEVEDAWCLQPNPTAMSFGIVHERAQTENVTPAIGIPVILEPATNRVEKINFPCVVERFPTRDRIQIHKNGELFKVFKEGKEIKLEDKVAQPLKELGATYVVEGYLLENNSIEICDLLCWNSVWYHRRTLSERLKMLWRFHDWGIERATAYNHVDITNIIKEWGDDIIIRNLNQRYNPELSNTRIQINMGGRHSLLEIGNVKGQKGRSGLKTSDKKAIFMLSTKVNPEENGTIVEVDRRGKVYKVLEKSVVPDTWENTAHNFQLDKDYDKYGKYRRLPEVKWPAEVEK